MTMNASIIETPFENDIFERLPSMAFDFTLFSPWTDPSDGRPVQIPLCIGALILCLREIQEQELKQGYSFLDDFSWSNPHNPPNLQRDVEDLKGWLFNNATTYPFCRDYLLTKSSRLLFETTLAILRLTASQIYPLSTKTCRILHYLSLLEPTHPYQMYLDEVLFDKATDSILQDNEGCLSDISTFIHQTYSCEESSRLDRLKLSKMFSRHLFHDLHMVKRNKTRNIIRFIMRSMMFIVRRYIFQVSARIRAARGESWKVNHVTMHPHINEFAISTIANQLGPIIFRFPKFVTQTREMAVRAMVNILCSNTERLWIPGQTFSKVNIETTVVKCHSGCICLNGA
ncbi:unnamed protein product [Rodentolepis nana]|uniref:Ras-GEF domain-containing protein n=1 Tax=Rodentolepis nana TaxID=102285 RepID=A0A0R3T1N1_RODNA|nr:unnamed protein product [Rodentolepis nana]